MQLVSGMLAGLAVLCAGEAVGLLAIVVLDWHAYRRIVRRALAEIWGRDQRRSCLRETQRSKVKA